MTVINSMFGIRNAGFGADALVLSHNRTGMDRLATLPKGPVSPQDVTRAYHAAGESAAQAKLLGELSKAHLKNLGAQAQVHATHVGHQLAVQGLRAQVSGNDARFVEGTANHQLSQQVRAAQLTGYVGAIHSRSQALFG